MFTAKNINIFTYKGINLLFNNYNYDSILLNVLYGGMDFIIIIFLIGLFIYSFIYLVLEENLNVTGVQLQDIYTSNTFVCVCVKMKWLIHKLTSSNITHY